MHPDDDVMQPMEKWLETDPDAAEVMRNYRMLEDRVIAPEMEHAALFLCSVLPRSRHRSLALTALEEATHWAIAARKR